MSSFQQVVMGGICLVAAFWFGSYINEQPANPLAQNVQLPMTQTADGRLIPTPQAPSFAEKTQGFLAALFDSPAQPTPKTIDQLKAQSPIASLRRESVVVNPATESDSHFRSPFVAQKPTPPQAAAVPTSHGQDYSDFQQTPAVVPNNDRIAIVPDFSTLARQLKRETRFPNDAPAPSSTLAGPATAETSGRKLPVPNINQLENKRIAQPVRDWNAVRQQVMSVEEKLNQFRQSQPVANAFQPTTTLAAGSIAQPALAEKPAVRQASSETILPNQDSLSPPSAPAQARRVTSETHPSFATPPTSPQGPRVASARPTFERPAQSQPETLRQRQSRWRVFGEENLAQRTTPANQSQAAASDDDRGDSVMMTSAPANGRVRSLNVGADAFRFSEPAVSSPKVSTRRLPVQTTEKEFVEPPVPVVRYEQFEDYVTRPNDTLQLISKQFYQSPEFYFDLYLANRDVLANPATVPVGIRLKIPRLDD